MKQFRIEWAKIPTNYNVHRVSIVEAENANDARELIRRNWERGGTCASEFAILSTDEHEEKKINGRIISTT